MKRTLKLIALLMVMTMAVSFMVACSEEETFNTTGPIAVGTYYHSDSDNLYITVINDTELTTCFDGETKHYTYTIQDGSIITVGDDGKTATSTFQCNDSKIIIDNETYNKK